MVVIRQMKRYEAADALNFDERTIHSFYRDNRLNRVDGGVGETVSGFLVDNHHENGLEEHFITNNALIIVRNHESHKFITALVARPGQVKRYYKALGRVAPKWLVKKAYDNFQNHLNY